MPTFKVLAGRHVEQDGTVYNKGDEIESDKDLDVLFAGKFQRLGGPTRKGRDELKSPEPKTTLPPTVAAKMQDKNVTGRKAVKRNELVAPEDDEVNTDEEVVDDEDAPEDEEVEDEAEPAEDEEVADEEVEEAEPVEEAEEEVEEEKPAPKPKTKPKAKPKGKPRK